MPKIRSNHSNWSTAQHWYGYGSINCCTIIFLMLTFIILREETINDKIEQRFGHCHRETVISSHTHNFYRTTYSILFQLKRGATLKRRQETKGNLSGIKRQWEYICANIFFLVILPYLTKPKQLHMQHADDSVVAIVDSLSANEAMTSHWTRLKQGNVADKNCINRVNKCPRNNNKCILHFSILVLMTKSSHLCLNR